MLNRLLRSALVLTPILLAGCQSVNSTNAGVVGVERNQYMFSLLSSEKLNSMSSERYIKTIGDAQSSGKLDSTSKIAKRVDEISLKLISQAPTFRPDAAQWKWEVSVIDEPTINAYCMPGGKIVVYTGIVESLNLTDDEIAVIVGHEIAHALREHGRERMSEAYGVAVAKAGAGRLLGLSQDTMELADSVVSYGMTLPNSREHENEADLIGLELAARAGYNPNAGVTVWQKMAKATAGQQPEEFASTHPSSETRISSLQVVIPKVMPLYEQAKPK